MIRLGGGRRKGEGFSSRCRWFGWVLPSRLDLQRMARRHEGGTLDRSPLRLPVTQGLATTATASLKEEEVGERDRSVVQVPSVTVTEPHTRTQKLGTL